MANPFDQFAADFQAALPPGAPGAPPPAAAAPENSSPFETGYQNPNPPAAPAAASTKPVMNSPPMSMPPPGQGGYGAPSYGGAPSFGGPPSYGGQPSYGMQQPPPQPSYGAPPSMNGMQPPQQPGSQPPAGVANQQTNSLSLVPSQPTGQQSYGSQYGVEPTSGGMPGGQQSSSSLGMPGGGQQPSPSPNPSFGGPAPPAEANPFAVPSAAPPAAAPAESNPYGAPPQAPPQQNGFPGAPSQNGFPGAPPQSSYPGAPSYAGASSQSSFPGAPPSSEGPYGGQPPAGPSAPTSNPPEAYQYGAPANPYGAPAMAPLGAQPPAFGAPPTESYGGPPPPAQGGDPYADPWGAPAAPAAPPVDPNMGALVPAQQQSNPYGMPPQQQQYGQNPYGQPQQPSYGAPPPSDPFSVFEASSAQPPPAPTGLPALPAPPVGAPAQMPPGEENLWGDLGFGAPPAAQQAPPPDTSSRELTVPDEKKSEDLPPGGEWYDARIFTPTLGVMFFKPQELTDSLFLNTDQSIVDGLAERPVVAFIVEGSSARAAGVELGHVLLKVNGVDVKNPKEASRLIKEGPRPLPLLFYVPNTDVVVAEGEHMVKYDTRETTAPNSAKDWKPKYVVIGGIIAQPWMMNMYRSKSEYDIAVIETQARRPVSVKVKQFSLQGARIQNDWQGPQMVKYKNKIHPWKYIVVLPVARNPIKISSPNLAQLKPVHEGIRRVLLAQNRDRGHRHSGGDYGHQSHGGQHHQSHGGQHHQSHGGQHHQSHGGQQQYRSQYDNHHHHQHAGYAGGPPRY